MMWIYAILFAVLIGVNFFGKDTVSAKKEEIDQGQLIEMLKKEEVGKIELVNREDAEIYLNQKGLSIRFPEANTPMGGVSPTPNYTYKIGSLDRFEEMVENVEDEGLLEPVEKDIIKSTIHFGDILAGQIMTPADQVVCVPVDISAEELKQVLLDEKYSRIPVIDGDKDHVVGVLPASKALYRLTNGKFSDVSDIMTRPYFIRSDIPVSVVFEGMSGRRTHLAVVSEDGKTLGIVTMEDILEEIAGEIYDEDEQEVSENAAS